MDPRKDIFSLWCAVLFLSLLAGCQSTKDKGTNPDISTVNAQCKEWLTPWRYTNQFKQDAHCRDDQVHCICGRACGNPQQVYYYQARMCASEHLCDNICLSGDKQ